MDAGLEVVNSNVYSANSRNMRLLDKELKTADAAGALLQYAELAPFPVGMPLDPLLQTSLFEEIERADLASMTPQQTTFAPHTTSGSAHGSRRHTA
jgi:hypothetical protein